MITLLHPSQIDLRELFSIKSVLNAKGFNVVKEGNGSDLLIPISQSVGADNDILFEAFNDQICRKEVLNYINNSSLIPTTFLALALTDHLHFRITSTPACNGRAW